MLAFANSKRKRLYKLYSPKTEENLVSFVLNTLMLLESLEAKNSETYAEKLVCGKSLNSFSATTDREKPIGSKRFICLQRPNHLKLPDFKKRLALAKNSPLFGELLNRVPKFIEICKSLCREIRKLYQSTTKKKRFTVI